jgi:hypothetical protein
MLDDRHYMRSQPPPRQWPLVYVIIAINVAVFVVQDGPEFDAHGRIRP